LHKPKIEGILSPKITPKRSPTKINHSLRAIDPLTPEINQSLACNGPLPNQTMMHRGKWAVPVGEWSRNPPRWTATRPQCALNLMRSALYVQLVILLFLLMLVSLSLFSAGGESYQIK